MQSPDKLIGKTLSEAIDELEQLKIPYRITDIDGCANILTSDYRMDRLNIVVKNNTITEMYYG
jgi:hypothetical protein